MTLRTTAEQRARWAERIANSYEPVSDWIAEDLLSDLSTILAEVERLKALHEQAPPGYALGDDETAALAVQCAKLQAERDALLSRLEVTDERVKAAIRVAYVIISKWAYAPPEKHKTTRDIAEEVSRAVITAFLGEQEKR